MANHPMAVAWASFLTEVIPPDASETQVTEMRRAFYAGAAALLRAVADIGDSVEDDDAGAARLMALDDELEAFGEAVQRGDA